MYKYILEGAGNINWMAIFALLTFFFMFVISAFTVLFRKREYVEKMSKLPLEDYPFSPSEIDNNNEK